MKPEHWNKFLMDMAETYQVKGKPRKVFLQRFDYENWGKSDTEIKNISDVPSIETYKKHANTIYKQFSKDKSNGCPKLDSSDPGAGKFEILRTWLQETMYPQWLTEQKSEVSSSSPVDIDWHEVCGKVLAQQRENQRLRRQATERGFELNVYVPLGLVERKQQQRRRGDVPLEEVYQLSEEVITKEYDNDKFLTEVIEPGKSRRIAIIGEPGAGKTTLQEKIAVWIHENDKGLPICIPLGGLQGKSLEDYLLQIWLKAALRFIEPDASGVEVRHIASLKQQFREGKVWLLLDGVDEMAATSPVEALATIKAQLTDWLVEARVVLTCRLNVWDANVNNMLTGFETYRTLEFKPEQVEDFIRQWFACAEESQQYCSDKTDLTPPAPLPYQGMGEPDSPLLAGEGQGERFACASESQRGEELLRKLQETGRERIRELVRNPLRLSLLCQTSYLLPVDEPLPETKAALYERFTRYFYEWKQEQHLDLTQQDELIDELHEALGKLALAGINSAARFRLGRKLARQVMGDRLFKLAERLNWLVLVDREAKTDEAVYAFFHPTFQEYFAAFAIEDWRYFLNHDNENPNPLLNPNPSLEYDNGKPAYRIFESQWKEVILLWLGRQEAELRKQKEQFIQALVEFQDNYLKPYWGFYQYRAYFLAAVGIAEFRDCSLADEIVRQMVEWAFGFFDPDKQTWMVRGFYPIRKYAKALLVETNRSRVIIVITELLDLCQDEHIRSKIAHSNGKRTEEDTIRQVALTLLEFSPGNFEAIKAITNLIDTSQDEPFKYLRESNTPLYTKIEWLNWEKQINQKTADILEKLITNKIDDKIDKIAVLIDVLHTKNANTFSEAQSRLDNIVTGNPYALPSIVNIIRQSLLWNKNSDYYPLFKALECLSKIGLSNPEAISSVKAVLERDIDYKNYAIKFNAVLALIAIGTGSQDAFNVLIERVHQRDDHLCYQTALSLQNILQGDLFRQAVVNLKSYLHNFIYENDRGFYIDCYWTLLHCAQNMTYTDFYQAWHQTTIHQRG